jgi:hypothetical protein
MSIPAKQLTRFLFCLSLTVFAYSEGRSSTEHDLNGNVVAENVYVNPALGMKITLGGKWDLLPPDSRQSSPPSDCRGPLCGNPEIDLILQTKASSMPAYRIYLAGYKLPPQYQNRERYPLNKLAEAMLAGSLGGSGLVPIGTQSPIQIDGKQAYRLLTGNPGEKVPKVIGYVSESNEYVFTLVLVGRNSNLQPLQSAIESMKFGSTNK